MHTHIHAALLLLFSVSVHIACCASLPHIIPLSHNTPEARSFKLLQDGELAQVEPQTRYKRDGVSDIPLTASGNSVIITCQITIGPSRNPFTVLLDTGSPLLALPTPGCTCDSGAPNPPYSQASNALLCSDSRCHSCCARGVCDTSKCGFALVYSDGTSLNGSVYQDTVEFGGLKSSVLFGGITQESSGFVAPYADGILGFSQDGTISCIPSCIPPVFSVFVDNGLVSNSFGIYLDFKGSGELSLGGIDQSIVNDEFTYTPLQQLSNHYQISLNAIQLEGSTVVSSLDAILDTGTTYILLPRSSYQTLVHFFQTNYCNLTGVCSQVNIFNGNCLLDIAKVEAFPDLTFQFDGLQISVKPSSYFLQTAMRGQPGYCFGVLPWSSDYAILGYTFMRGYYIFYDMENRRIGFAGSNSTIALDRSSHAPIHHPPLFFSLLAVLYFLLSLNL